MKRIKTIALVSALIFLIDIYTSSASCDESGSSQENHIKL